MKKNSVSLDSQRRFDCCHWYCGLLWRHHDTRVKYWLGSPSKRHQEIYESLFREIQQLFSSQNKRKLRIHWWISLVHRLFQINIDASEPGCAALQSRAHQWCGISAELWFRRHVIPDLLTKKTRCISHWVCPKRNKLSINMYIYLCINMYACVYIYIYIYSICMVLYWYGKTVGIRPMRSVSWLFVIKTYLRYPPNSKWCSFRCLTSFSEVFYDWLSMTGGNSPVIFDKPISVSVSISHRTALISWR